MRKLLTALILALLLSSASAQAERRAALFESDVRINPDGSALVLESYEFATPPGNFTRRIRTEAPTAFSNRVYLIDVAVVDDEAGRDVPYDVMRYGGHMRIEIPHFSGNRLQLAYRVSNAVDFGGPNDEFLWIANEAAIPADTAVFKVNLPDPAAGQIRAQGFLRTGGGAPRTALWSFNGAMITAVDGASVEVVAPGPLVPGVVAVIHVSIPSGILKRPSQLTEAGWFLRANPIVFLPVCVFAVMFTIWQVKRRKGDPGRSIAPMYEPPEGLSPAEVGTLVDDRVDARDITATLIDLAVRGYVKLERTTPEQGVFGDREDFVVRLLKPKEEWYSLKQHEKTMLFHTFYGGQWTQLSSLRLRFPDIVPYMRRNIFTQLKGAGMYRIDPENVPAVHQATLGFVYLAIWALVHIPWTTVGGLIGPVRPVATIISLVVSGAIVTLLGRKSSPKTMRGMQTYVAIRGFEEFIRTVEADRLKRLEPGLFEKYLPYAMALGVEHRWTRAFEGIAIKQPEWVEFTDDLFDTVAFGHRLESAFHSSDLSTPRGRLTGPIAEAFGRAAVTGTAIGR